MFLTPISYAAERYLFSQALGSSPPPPPYPSGGGPVAWRGLAGPCGGSDHSLPLEGADPEAAGDPRYRFAGGQKPGTNAPRRPFPSPSSRHKNEGFSVVQTFLTPRGRAVPHQGVATRLTLVWFRGIDYVIPLPLWWSSHLHTG